MTRIATGTGDDGTTSLFQGGRVSKSHPRVEAYGHVDELNATLGLVHAASTREDECEWIERVQRELFVLGADLATPGEEGMRVSADMVARLDNEIDEMEAEMPELSTFLLPSGDELAVRYHVARTVCRRAERRVVEANAQVDDGIGPHCIVYLNRLSDLLFLKARRRSLDAGTEVPMDFEAYR